MSDQINIGSSATTTSSGEAVNLGSGDPGTDNGYPDSVLTARETQVLDEAVDADAATGERSVVDDSEPLPADDVNAAVCDSGDDHEAHIGEPVMDDDAAEVGRILVAGAYTGDGV